jgi:hypothetical protein
VFIDALLKSGPGVLNMFALYQESAMPSIQNGNHHRSSAAGATDAAKDRRQ